MKKPFRYLLAGVLTLLGFSSCSALREAREARAAREREAWEKQQRELVEQTLQEMLEHDARVANDTVPPEFERVRLLYAVPNVPYREIKEK